MEPQLSTEDLESTPPSIKMKRFSELTYSGIEMKENVSQSILDNSELFIEDNLKTVNTPSTSGTKSSLNVENDSN